MKVETPVWHIKAYVYGHAGYFMYAVDSLEQACGHAQKIAEDRVYRRVNENNELEMFPLHKVKVVGPGINTEYPDEFVRT